MTNRTKADLLPSVAATASGAGEDFSTPPGIAAVYLDVTAAALLSRTTLDVDIEVKDEVTGQYYVYDSFAQLVAVTGSERIEVPLLADKVMRIAYALVAPEVAVTFTNAANTVNATAHGFLLNDRIQFVEDTGGLPTELAEATLYHVITVNANDFQVALTQGGAAVTFSDDGTAIVNATNYDTMTYTLAAAMCWIDPE